MALNKQKRDIKRKNRNRYSLKKHSGSKPRLSVYRSNQHIYAQIIDDINGTTLYAASTMDKDFQKKKAFGGKYICSKRNWIYNSKDSIKSRSKRSGI